MRTSLLAAVLLLASPGWAIDYTCPTDPGFCYFDVGDDGCFDVGTDSGPIDAQLQAGEYPSPLPPGTDLPTDPGSIVCPPSIKKLEITVPFTGIDFRTALGSHIVFHRAKLEADGQYTLDFRSGGDIRLGGDLLRFQDVVICAPGPTDASLSAAEDVVLEGDVDVRACSADLLVTATGGQLTVGDKVRLMADALELEASGDIALGDRVLINQNSAQPTSTITSTSGDVIAGALKFRPFRNNGLSIEIVGDDVSILGKLKFPRSSSLTITASGDATLNQPSFPRDSGFNIIASNISIGTADKKAKLGYFDVDATGTITATRLKVKGNGEFTTTGTDVSVANSSFKGPNDPTPPPTIEVTAGPGSTCDLTGSTFKKTTLVTSCDTVIGP